MGRLIDWWKSGSLFREKWWPWAVGLLAPLVHFLLGQPLIPVDAFFHIMAASVGASAILVGFLGAALAVLLSIKGTRAGKILGQEGYLDILHRYLRSALFASMFFAIWSMYCMFFDPAIISAWQIAIWYFLAVATLGLYARFTLILFKILWIK